MRHLCNVLSLDQVEVVEVRQQVPGPGVQQPVDLQVPCELGHVGVVHEVTGDRHSVLYIQIPTINQSITDRWINQSINRWNH